MVHCCCEFSEIYGIRLRIASGWRRGHCAACEERVWSRIVRRDVDLRWRAWKMGGRRLVRVEEAGSMKASLNQHSLHRRNLRQCGSAADQPTARHLPNHRLVGPCDLLAKPGQYQSQQRVYIECLQIHKTSCYARTPNPAKGGPQAVT